MGERIFVIDRIQDVTYDGRVTGKECFDSTGQSVKVKSGQKDVLKNRWGELQVGRAYSFTMGIFNNFPFVQNFKLHEGEVPEPRPLPPNPPTLGEGAARGMTCKEVGDHIRAGTLSTVFGKKIATTLLVWYRGELLGITKVSFDGKNLPKFGKEEDLRTS